LLAAIMAEEQPTAEDVLPEQESTVGVEPEQGDWAEEETKRLWVEEQRKKGKHVEKRGPYVAVTEKMYAGQIDLDRAIERQLEIVQLGRIWGGWDGFVSGVLMLVDLIPKEAWDDQFTEDMGKAYQKIRVQHQMHYTMESPYGYDHNNGNDGVKLVFDPTAAFRAVINMLHRRGKYWRETQRATLW